MKKALIIIPILLILGGGTVVGLAFMGTLKIPGLTPKHLMQGKKQIDKKIEKPKPVTKAPVKKEEPTEDPSAGQTALASYWNGLEPDRLAEITKSWRPGDLAPILLKMDADKVTALLGELEAKRASDVSREIQRLASQPS